jgi:hypothetical protein
MLTYLHENASLVSVVLIATKQARGGLWHAPTSVEDVETDETIAKESTRMNRSERQGLRQPTAPSTSITTLPLLS